MPSSMIIHKKAAYGGGTTSAMSQQVAQTYLGNLLRGTRVTNLSQALNQAFNGQGKSNGSKRFGGHDTFHASAGVSGVSSVTLFYYVQGETIHLFAMGEHAASSTYNLCDFRPETGDFGHNRVTL